MKISKKIARKLSFYITFLACMASLWMLVVRFNYPVETFISYSLISIVFLLILILLAACIAFLIRRISSSGSNSEEENMFAHLTSASTSVIASTVTNNKANPLKLDESKHEYE